MPKEHRKRGRREDRKRKREEEQYDELPKRQRVQEGEDVEGEIEGMDGNGADYEAPYTSNLGPGNLPYYGLLEEEEQEYFKRADSMLELNQFENAEERALFLANVYKEANGKELKIANSQSCSRLMERLISLSTPSQLKALFQKFSGHFLSLVQHRFASHCCEALFLKAAPIVTQELIESGEEENLDGGSGEVYVSMENLFLYTINELEGNIGYLITNQFSSHPLRVLLVVLSGMPIAGVGSSLLQSKKKEHVSTTTGSKKDTEVDMDYRTVPVSFNDALNKMLAGALAGLDTTSLRALATHPVANPVLQLLLELELTRSGKKCAKDPNSLFRKLLPDDPLEEGAESASFVNSLAYDTIGSRLLEVVVTHAPGKTFKVLYRCFFGNKLESLTRNETAAFVVIKVIERLNKEDLQTVLGQICSQIDTLVNRSRTSVIKTLIERCRIRELDTKPISIALEEAYGKEPSERLMKMLKVSEAPPAGMADDRRQRLDAQDGTKAHGSLLAQCMLESPGPLRELITDGLLAMESPTLINIAKDRRASRVLQMSLSCLEESLKFRRVLITRLCGNTADLALDTVGSHVVDSLWQATDGLLFLRERVAQELAGQEVSLRASISGRAVWRNWKMDIYKTRKKEWLNDAKGQDRPIKTGIELARERFAAKKPFNQHKSSYASGANKILGRQALARGKA